MNLEQLEHRVSVLEAIHKLGPPTAVPRHIASPTEEDLQRERDEARAMALDYYQDLAYMGDYLFNKHHGADLELYPWLAQMLADASPREADE